MKMRTMTTCVGALAITSGAWAQQPGQRVDAKLSSGDVIRGVLVSDDGTTIVLKHPVLGQLSLAKSDVSMVVVPDPNAPAPPPPPPPAPEVKPDPETFWQGWTGSIDAGVTGSSGNSEAFAAKVGLTFERDTSKTDTKVGFLYVFGSQDGEKNLDRGEFGIRNDWKIGSPWRIYAGAKAEYDQFQDWDWRLSAVVGAGYELINTPNTLLLARAGIGMSKEFGGEKQRIEPELDLGMDWEHKFDERSKIFANFDYYPSLHNFSQYRAEAKAGYEIIVDPVNKLSLKLGVDDKYQSNPGDDKKKNDVLYFATIGYSF